MAIGKTDQMWELDCLRKRWFSQKFSAWHSGEVTRAAVLLAFVLSDLSPSRPRYSSSTPTGGLSLSVRQNREVI